MAPGPPASSRGEAWSGPCDRAAEAYTAQDQRIWPLRDGDALVVRTWRSDSCSDLASRRPERYPGREDQHGDGGMPTTEGVAINHIIETMSSIPAYEQLRRRIAAQIDAGELEVDSRLPTVRDLAQQTGLANNTIAKTYRGLEAAGYIRTEGRRGTFVAARRDPRDDGNHDLTTPDPVSLCMSTEMSLLRRDAFPDEETLDTWFDPSFTMVHRDGRLLGRREALEAMRADTAEPSTVEELLAERLGPSIVILSYVTRRESLTCRHSSIWVGGVAGWRCRYRHSTPLVAPVVPLP